jgi:hypothetical protein
MASPKLAKTDPYASLVDELGGLEKELAPFAQQLARIELLKKTLRGVCPASDDVEWSVSGARFIALLGPRALERKIDIKALVKAIGAPAFAKFASCTLKALEASVEPAIAAGVISSDRTGSRSLKLFERRAA